MVLGWHAGSGQPPYLAACPAAACRGWACRAYLVVPLYSGQVVAAGQAFVVVPAFVAGLVGVACSSAIVVRMVMCLAATG